MYASSSDETVAAIANRPESYVMKEPTRRPTIVDVAGAAGVSVSTVSRVINGKQDVSPETREAVLRAMEAAGYKISPVARSLVGARTRMLGIYIRYLTPEFSTELISGVIEAAEEMEYGTVLFAGERASRIQGASLISTLPDGLLVVSPGFDGNEEMLWLDTDKPVLFIEPPRTYAGNVTLTVMNRSGERELAEYLLALGHKRIGYVAGPPNIAASLERLLGFQDAFAKHNLELAPDLIQDGDFSREGGLRAAQRLLRLDPRPTAIIAANDYEAFGVLQAAHEAGLRVPEDLSVAGFDDVYTARHMNPPLTSVRQPLYEMGRRAAEMLIEWIQGFAPTDLSVSLPTSLVKRESCGPPSPRAIL